MRVKNLHEGVRHGKLVCKGFCDAPNIPQGARGNYQEVPSNRGAYVLACDCGGVYFLSDSCYKLQRKSCGCSGRDDAARIGKCSAKSGKWVKDRNVFLAGRVLKGYRTNAKNRNIFFGITKEDVLALIKKPCFYCGDPGSNTLRTKHQSGYVEELVYNGIDRISSDLGYVPDNLVPCCKVCNTVKMDLSSKEFKEWCKRVYDWSILLKREYIPEDRENIYDLSMNTRYKRREEYFAKTIKNCYIKNSKSRGLSFDLSDEEVLSLVVQRCFYCGSGPSNAISRKRISGITEVFWYSGIDRVDSLSGYFKDNVVPCCRICNSVKMKLSKNDFLSWVARIGRVSGAS